MPAQARDDERHSASRNDHGKSGGWWGMAKSAFSDFGADAAMTHAAAVAFYSALSFAPLVMLAIFIFGRLDDIAGTGTQEQVIGEISNLMGERAAEVIDDVRDQQQDQELTLFSFTGILALIVLVWSASGVFAQLQAALNAIWDVEPSPDAGVMGWLRKRGLSAGIVLAILFLLLVSLIITALLNAILGGDGGILWTLLDLVVSAAVYVALFALIFKYLPDVEIPWKAVWLGAIVTALLFAIGKWLIGLYLGQSDPGSAYGAAGSVVVLLVWVYYSGIILFLGAEFTQAWAKHQGLQVMPAEHARAALSKKQWPANTAAQRQRMNEPARPHP